MLKIKKALFHLAIILFIFSVLQSGSRGDDGSARHIGTPIGTPIDLEGDSNIEGIAFDEKSQELLVLNDVDNDLDGNGLAETGEQVHIYAYDPVLSTLVLRSSLTIPAAANTGDIL